MARYHFQVRTETHVLVTESADLASLLEVRVEAAKRIGALLHEHAGRLWADEEWRMDVTDDVGLILFYLQVSAFETAAVPDPSPRSE